MLPCARAALSNDSIHLLWAVDSVRKRVWLRPLPPTSQRARNSLSGPHPVPSCEQVHRTSVSARITRAQPYHGEPDTPWLRPRWNRRARAKVPPRMPSASIGQAEGGMLVATRDYADTQYTQWLQGG